MVSLQVLMWLFFIIAVVVMIVVFYMRLPKFGKSPSGERMGRIKSSANYKNGKFDNLNYTPTLTEGFNYAQVIYRNYFKRSPDRIPSYQIPAVKTDLHNLPVDGEILVWFGHSSYFMQLGGIKILVDPVFSGNASPLPGTVKSFHGADIYSADDMPEIDYLFITHDHYDHVDYLTLKGLKNKVKHVICGLGVGSHFEHWGYAPEIISEGDWGDMLIPENGFQINFEPARHFSGRGLKRNNTLWVSYILQTAKLTIYLGGDSGYDTHYANIGAKYGPIDLAILDNGQYNVAWKYIHNIGEDVLRAAKDLKAKRIFPVHSAKFALSTHPWNEPLVQLVELNKAYNIPIITPLIGELVYLNDTDQHFKKWWVGLS